jgi:hypothetical protein
MDVLVQTQAGGGIGGYELGYEDGEAAKSSLRHSSQTARKPQPATWLQPPAMFRGKTTDAILSRA